MKKIFLFFALIFFCAYLSAQNIIMMSNAQSDAIGNYPAQIPAGYIPNKITITTDRLYNGTTATATIQYSDDGYTWTTDGSQSVTTISGSNTSYVFNITTTNLWQRIKYMPGNAHRGSLSATLNYIINSPLPNQVGQSGNFLTTNGINANWSPAGFSGVTATAPLSISSNTISISTSPAFTGIPTAPTNTATITNTTQLATTAFVQSVFQQYSWQDITLTCSEVGLTVATYTVNSDVRIKQIDAHTYLCNFYILGTSNSTSFNITLPFTSDATTNNISQVQVECGDAGVFSSSILGTIVPNPGTTTLTFYKTNAASATSWTASGTKGIFGQIFINTQ